ncbi:MAG: dephospho-CoA kinase [Bacteroidia bacterium]|jgi:dephospho-CoA kinase
MLHVGITGGIGSGKTTAARIFNILGIPVYDADKRAKALYNESEVVKKAVMALLGNNVYSENGTADYTLIAERVFSNDELLKQLNAIIHPHVALDYENWRQNQKAVPYTLKEAALIIEAHTDKQLDYLIAVDAPESLRIERVMKRSGLTKDKVLQRINNQPLVAAALEKADVVIKNDDRMAIIPQVLSIHSQLIERSHSHQ